MLQYINIWDDFHILLLKITSPHQLLLFLFQKHIFKNSLISHELCAASTIIWALLLYKTNPPLLTKQGIKSLCIVILVSNLYNWCVPEFHGMKGQGYCQGGFSADFTKVSSLNPFNRLCFQYIFVQLFFNYCWNTGWEGSTWRTRQLFLAR